MNRFIRGIAMTSARHPWRTVSAWVAVLVGVFVLAGAGGGTFT
jgi:RND superfamily putative drug exporter